MYLSVLPLLWSVLWSVLWSKHFRKKGDFRASLKTPQNPPKTQLLQKKKSRNLTISRLFGGDKRDQTADLLDVVSANRGQNEYK